MPKLFLLMLILKRRRLQTWDIDQPASKIRRLDFVKSQYTVHSEFPANSGCEQHGRNRSPSSGRRGIGLVHNITQMQQQRNIDDEANSYTSVNPQICKRKRKAISTFTNTGETESPPCQRLKIEPGCGQHSIESQSQTVDHTSVSQETAMRMERKPMDEVDAAYNHFNFWREVLPSIDEEILGLSAQADCSSDTEMDAEGYVGYEDSSSMCLADPSFNQFNFWKNPIPELDIKDLN